MGSCVNIMGSCVSFQIKAQILAFYTDMCTSPKETYNLFYSLAVYFGQILFPCTINCFGNILLHKGPYLYKLEIVASRSLFSIERANLGLLYFFNWNTTAQHVSLETKISPDNGSLSIETCYAVVIQLEQ